MTSSAIASACSNWRLAIAVRASRSLASGRLPIVRLLRRARPGAAAILGPRFLDFLGHLGRRVVEQPPLDVERLGLVDLVLGHVVVAQ